MSGAVRELLRYDLMPLSATVLAALVCGVTGNFLVLRRQAMLGDAISHSVLPGLAVAFIVSSGASTAPMLVGAGVAAVVAALLIGVVGRAARLAPDASMGVVFSVMFALGVVLISVYARDSHVDAECMLYGRLEHLGLSSWRPPESVWGLLSARGWAGAPRQVTMLAAAAAFVVVVVAALFKELRLVSFDPGLASALGFRSRLVGSVMLVLVALSVTASFEAVGVILVVGMLTCPAVVARTCTDRLWSQVVVSAVVSVVSAVCGYWAATRGVGLLTGGRIPDVEVAGMVAALGGVGVVLSVVFAPRHGALAGRLRQSRQRDRVAREDLIGLLYRIEEVEADGRVGAVLPDDVASIVRSVARTRRERASARRAVGRAVRRRLVLRSGDRLKLTVEGRSEAAGLVRSHRLWESYLVRELGLRPDHVHDTAMVLEHITSPEMVAKLRARVVGERDPHGRAIPE